MIAYQSLLIKVFDLEGTFKRSFKAHEAPVLAMDIDPTSSLVATGSADSTVKVWDIEKGHCTHNFKGHSGIISAVRFHYAPAKLHLASGSDDCKVRLWDLYARSCLAVLDSHVSVVRDFSFSEDGYLFSAGRDKVYNKWNLEELELAQTVPVFESIESLHLVDFQGRQAVCTAGEQGVFKLWDPESGELIIEQEKNPHTQHEIVSSM